MVFHLCIVSYLFIPKCYYCGLTFHAADEVAGVLETELPPAAGFERNVATSRTNAVFFSFFIQEMCVFTCSFCMHTCEV